MNSKKVKMILGGAILVGAMALNSVNAVVTSSTFLKGDINRDSKITLDDCELIKQHIMEEVTLDEEQLYLADVDCQNGITSADYVKLKNYIEGRSFRFLIGDVTRDEKITQDDYTLILDSVKGIVTLDPEQEHLADVDESGSVNLTDYAKLLRIIKGLETRYMIGDVTRDGNINMDDCNAILNHVKKISLLDEEQIWLADLSEDSNISLTDYTKLLRIVKGVETRFLKGDVNRDSKITLDDCELIKQHIMEEVVLDDEQLCLADVDGENGITAADYVKLKNYIEGRSYRFLKGDVNRDGKITSDDYALILDRVKGNLTLDPEQEHLADIDENDTVNITDSTKLLRIINGLEKRYELGDIDRDGAVTSKDCELIEEYVRDNSVLDEEQIWLGDINGDGKVNAGDYAALLNVIREEANNCIKGDLDRNGVVDANDASIALELYKAQNALMEDIIVGDLDNNNLIDANDASLILELYKTNN